MFKSVITILILGAARVARAGSTVSIDDPVTYGGMPDCVQECILDLPLEGFQGLGHALQCDYPVLNACYCATASAAVASTYLSSCISNDCAAGDAAFEITSAISLYDNYCLTAGYTMPGVTAIAAAATTMVTSTAKAGALANGVTQTGVSPTSTSTSSSSGGDTLSRPAELATIFSAIFGTILAVAAIWVAVHYGRRGR